jgi:TPR repeat protein
MAPVVTLAPGPHQQQWIREERGDGHQRSVLTYMRIMALREPASTLFEDFAFEERFPVLRDFQWTFVDEGTVRGPSEWTVDEGSSAFVATCPRRRPSCLRTMRSSTGGALGVIFRAGPKERLARVTPRIVGYAASVIMPPARMFAGFLAVLVAASAGCRVGDPCMYGPANCGIPKNTDPDQEAKPGWSRRCDAAFPGVDVGDDEVPEPQFLRRLRADCRRGAARACGDVGFAVQFGCRTRKNPTQAFELYRWACEAGERRSCERLSEGGVPDRALADRGIVALLTKACDADEPSACIALGEVHRRGQRSVPASPELAARVLARACDLEEPEGCRDLTELYAAGAVPGKTKEDAALLAASYCYGDKNRWTWACKWIVDFGWKYEIGGADAAARKWYTNACDSGYGPACDDARRVGEPLPPQVPVVRVKERLAELERRIHDRTTHPTVRRAALRDLLDLRRITAVNLTGAVLAGLELTKVSLFGIDLSAADLGGARLELVNARVVSLRGATLRSARLKWVDLRGADLSGADLSEASLRHTNLSTTRLDGARFTRATYDDGTRFPPGFSAARHGMILVNEKSR